MAFNEQVGPRHMHKACFVLCCMCTKEKREKSGGKIERVKLLLTAIKSLLSLCCAGTTVGIRDAFLLYHNSLRTCSIVRFIYNGMIL